MNMLSKPVERCRKTSCSLNLSLVLSALNALYKLLEIFCCNLSLKKPLQAKHISVQSAHRTSLRWPAARTAARKSASSHALRVIRSIGGLSSSRSASSGAVGLLRPDETLTVECTIGSPKVFASFTVDTMFFSTTSDPWTGPRRSARAGSRSPAAPRSAASAGGRRSGRESWVHPPAVAEVEADRLHHLERRALGEDVGGREHPGVLLDHGRGCGSDPLFQAALERSPGVVAVLHEVARQVDGVERLPGALGDVRHVLLMQGNVLAGAEPAEVAGDEVLPRIGQRLRRRLEVARDVLGQVREENRRPARVDDVDQHQRAVIGQADDDVVGRVIGAVQDEHYPLAADLQRAWILERHLARGTDRIDYDQ